MMDARISIGNSQPGAAHILIECPGDREEIERANLYVTPQMGDALESMTQWSARHAFFVQLEDKDALAALRVAVDILEILRENGLLNMSDIAA